MTMRKFWASCGICLILVLSLTFFSGAAVAQESAARKESDKKILQREGVEGSLAETSSLTETDGPTRFQMGIGIGSCVVAFIAWKWL